MALPREVAKEVFGEARRPARVHEEVEQACACQMPSHKRQHLGIEKSADVLKRTFAHRGAIVNLGWYPVYAGRVKVFGWNVDGTQIHARCESDPLLEAGAMEFRLAGKPAQPSANE